MVLMVNMRKLIRYLVLGVACMLVFAGSLYGQGDTAFVQRRDWMSGQREVFPDWLLEAPSEERFIAVSEPGLKPEVAREQARLRAAFLCALRQGVKVGVVCDYFNSSRRYYEQELTADKLVTMLRVEVVLSDSGWTTGREWENRYGEYAVEVFPRPDYRGDRCQGKVAGELMVVSSGGYRERNEIRCVWTGGWDCPGRIRNSRYTLKGNAASPVIETRLNDTLLRIPREGYWYAVRDSLTPDVSGRGYPLNHGLWCAQMQSLLYALAGHAWPQVQAKMLGEGSAAGGSDSGLHRQVVRASVTVTAGRWRWKDNRLDVDWKIEDL